jgi:hypothetical protein
MNLISLTADGSENMGTKKEPKLIAGEELVTGAPFSIKSSDLQICPELLRTDGFATI